MPLHASSLNPDLVTGGVSLAGSRHPLTIACQASLTMGFPRQEYWSGLTFPSPEDLTDPGIEPVLYCRQILYW